MLFSHSFISVIVCLPHYHVCSMRIRTLFLPTATLTHLTLGLTPVVTQEDLDINNTLALVQSTVLRI